MCWRCFQNFDASAPVLAYGRKVKVGARGLTGPTGPTTAAQSEAGTLPAISGPNTGTLSFPQATIDIPTAGKVFVFANVFAGASCPAGTFNCDFDVGVFIDGQPVTGPYGHFLLTPGTEGGESHMAAIALGGSATAPRRSAHVAAPIGR